MQGRNTAYCDVDPSGGYVDVDVSTLTHTYLVDHHAQQRSLLVDYLLFRSHTALQAPALQYHNHTQPQAPVQAVLELEAG